MKCQPHKIVKHTQTINQLLPTNCLSVFGHFVGLTLIGIILQNTQKYLNKWEYYHEEGSFDLDQGFKYLFLGNSCNVWFSKVNHIYGLNTENINIMKWTGPLTNHFQALLRLCPQNQAMFIRADLGKQKQKRQIVKIKQNNVKNLQLRFLVSFVQQYHESIA